jgi:short-subunit dehydrogenase
MNISSKPQQKVVLITGASSGIGQATAQLLTKRGFKVFGTSRKPDKAKAADFEMLQLDVCSDESVNACVQVLMERAGRMDVLINNAGYYIAGAIEETTISEAKAQFETYFFGVARMVNAVLPIMRQQRSGHIINISSPGGFAAVPFHGFYCASKHALEGYTETLRYELKPLNIRVSIVQSGAVRTEAVNSMQPVAHSIDDYAPVRNRVVESFKKFQQTGLAPTFVATTIYRIIESKSPRLRYRVGIQSKLLPIMRSILPEALFESGARSTFKLDSSK